MKKMNIGNKKINYWILGASSSRVAPENGVQKTFNDKGGELGENWWNGTISWPGVAVKTGTEQLAGEMEVEMEIDVRNNS